MRHNPHHGHDPAAGSQAITADALSTIIDAYLGEAAPDPRREHDVHRTLRAAVDRAHAQGVEVEQFVIALKAAWYAHPRVRAHADPRERRRLLERLVSLAIEGYYAD